MKDCGHCGGDAPCDGADGPGRRAIRDSIEYQFEQEGRHCRPFRIVQPVGVSQTLRGTRRRDQPVRTIAIDQVLGDGPRFGHGRLAVHDDGRLSQWVHREQFGRGQHGLRVPLVALHFVRYPQLFQQPQYPLRPRVIEMVHRDHAGIVWHSRATNTAGIPLTKTRCDDVPFSSRVSQSVVPGRSVPPGGNHAAFTERNSGNASQRSAITASPG